MVDDNVDVTDTIAEILGMLGHEVAIAYDGLSAITAALANLPDIIFLDIGMPGIDGYEVARRIRCDQRSQHVILIALTEWGQEQDRHLAYQAGCDDHLTKPLSLVQLQDILEQVWRKQAASKTI